MIRRGRNVFQYVFLTVLSILSVFPLYYMFCGSTNKSADVVGGRLIPGTYLWINLQSLIADHNVGAALLNSLRNATIITLLSLVICSIAGYGFEIYHDKGKDILMSILLLAVMIPFAVTMIPLFRIFSQMKLVNTMTAIVLPSISTPFLIMLFRQSARSFPHEIIEAARLDGMTEVGIFFKMFIPTMKSTYAAAMTITFMGAWNSYMWPKIILQTNDSITIPMLVGNAMGGHYVDYGMLMVSILICTIPTAIIFLTLQKSFAEGITGAIK